MSRLAPLLAAALLITTLAACGATPTLDEDGSDRTSPDTAHPEEAATGAGGTDDAEVGVDEGIGNGRDDGPADTGDLHAEIAAARTLLGAEQAEVIAADRVTWPDGSIGCPDPDMMYTMALVEGYRIVLDDDGTQVTLHGADGQPPFRCDTPSSPAGPDGVQDR